MTREPVPVVVALVAALVVLSLVPVPAAADSWVTGEPDLDFSVAENHFDSGEGATLELQVANDGTIVQGGPAEFEQRVKTARNVKLRVLDDRLPPGIEVKTGTVLAGTIPEGSAGPYSFALEIGDGVSPGRYELPIEVAYDYTFGVEFSGNSPQFVDSSRRLIERVEIVVEEGPRFRIVGTSSTAVVGQDGTLTVDLKNVGTEPAYDAAVTLRSPNPGVVLGTESSTAEVFVGGWEPGSTRRVEYALTVANRSGPRRFALQATVRYEDGAGLPYESETLTTGFTPEAEQRFRLEDVNGTLRVDEEGSLRGMVVNEGPIAAENALLVLRTENPNVTPVDTEYALGRLDAGESVPFEFGIEISSNADAGPRQFTLSVRYQNADGERRRSKALEARTGVAPKRDTFDVTPVNATVRAGSSTRLVLEVENAADETLTDISAKLFADDPIATDDDEGFIDELAPGESARVTFAVSAGGGAIEKTYPVSVDFQYEDEGGDTLLSDTYRVPVAVVERRGGRRFPGFALPIALGAVGALALAGYLLRRR